MFFLNSFNCMHINLFACNVDSKYLLGFGYDKFISRNINKSLIKTGDIVNLSFIYKPDVKYLSPLYCHNSPVCLLCLMMNFSKKLDTKVIIPRVTAAWSPPPPPLPPHYCQVLCQSVVVEWSLAFLWQLHSTVTTMKWT